MRELLAVAVAVMLSAAAQAADFTPAAEGDKTPFPTVEWTEFDANDPFRVKMQAIVDRAFEGARPAALARMRAMVVAVHGRIAAERYAHGITRDTRLQSWSMAKSILHAALGMAALDGKIDPGAAPSVPEWNDVRRREIKLSQLMAMSDGLAFEENYGDTNSHVMQMLFGEGRGDVGAFAARSKPGDSPGVSWNYSSGSANILSRVLRDVLGGREAYARFLKERLFLPLGMRSAVAEFDASGTWIASSYVHATARDFARFGLFYLRQGFWDGRQLIAREWAKAACAAPFEAVPVDVSAVINASGGRYGQLFWLNRKDRATGRRAVSDDLPEDLCFARGFGGQLIAIVPSADAVVVMLNGAYTEENAPIVHLIADLLDAAAGKT